MARFLFKDKLRLPLAGPIYEFDTQISVAEDLVAVLNDVFCPAVDFNSPYPGPGGHEEPADLQTVFLTIEKLMDPSDYVVVRAVKAESWNGSYFNLGIDPPTGRIFPADSIVEARVVDTQYYSFLSTGETLAPHPTEPWSWTTVPVQLSIFPTIVPDFANVVHTSGTSTLTVPIDVKAMGLLNPSTAQVTCEWLKGDESFSSDPGAYSTSGPYALATGIAFAQSVNITGVTSLSPYYKVLVRFIITDTNNPDFIYRTRHWVFDNTNVTMA